MATNIGEATIKLAFDNKSLDASQKQVESSMNSWTSKLGSIAKTGGKLIAGGLAAATAAVTGVATASVKGYAEFEQLQGGVESMFGGMEKGAEQINKVMALSENAWKDLTISKNEYMSSFMASYPLIANGMDDQNQAIEYTQRLLTLNSDLANTFGYSMETASTAINWALKGNYSYLDNLNIGIKGTKEGFEEAARAIGYTDEQLENITGVDILTVLEKSAAQFGVLGKTAAEAGNTIQGSFKMAKGAAQDLITGLTDPNADLGQLIDNLITSIVGDGTDKNLGVLGNLKPAIEQALKGISKLIEQGVPILIEMVPNILADTIPSVLESAVNLFGRIVDYLPQLAQTLINLISQIAQQIIPRLPQLLLGIVNGILGVIKTLTSTENLRTILNVGLQLLLGLVQAIPQIVVALVEALPDIITGIVGFLTDPNSLMLIIQAGVELFMGLVAAVPQILGALITAFAELFRKLWEQVKKNFSEFAANFGESIASVFKKAINGVLQFIENFINGPIDLINSFIQTINDNFGAIGVNIGKISHVSLPRLAQGGIATSATTAIIGEAGREAVIPLERNTDNWAGLLSRTLANEFKDQGLSTEQGITIYMTNEINNELDADEIGRRLLTSIRRAA